MVAGFTLLSINEKIIMTHIRFYWEIENSLWDIEFLNQDFWWSAKGKNVLSKQWEQLKKSINEISSIQTNLSSSESRPIADGVDRCSFVIEGTVCSDSELEIVYLFGFYIS